MFDQLAPIELRWVRNSVLDGCLCHSIDSKNGSLNSNIAWMSMHALNTLMLNLELS